MEGPEKQDQGSAGSLPAQRGQADPLAEREELRRLCLEAGFDRAGFAEAGPAPHAAHLEEWLARGYAGAMGYMERSPERRADPRRVVPGARTVFALALHYGSPEPSERSCRSLEEARRLASSGKGEISRYARGTDYHRVLESRLKRLCQTLRERHPGHRFRYYADTGPVLERSWAEAAGLGWIGKNGCAIDPRRGSYFFIGTVLTTLEVAPDRPSADHCGSCRLCIDACPTAAIVEPYRIDSRRCISYLTIENRGPMEEGLREQVGGLVFGCDICQEVCPFNRPERLEGEPELASRPENLRPALEELARLSAAGFAARFPKSAVKRARSRGLLRNVLIAIGQSGRADLRGLLDELSTNEELSADETLREALRWARVRLRG
jgi:epoxyqueuosine reductase